MNEGMTFESNNHYRVRLNRSIQVGRTTIRPSAVDIVLSGEVCAANAEAITSAVQLQNGALGPSDDQGDGNGRDIGQQAT